MFNTLRALAPLACVFWVHQFYCSALQAQQVQLDVRLARPTMHIQPTGKGENHLRIALTGFEPSSEQERRPINVAIVIDKSGSMQGEKIEQARRAAIQAVERLRDNDVVSVIAYDSAVSVIWPATKATDRKRIQAQLRNIQAGGNTALFAGVSKGADEIRKFLDDKQVNRIILLSDGLANVGPSSPAELEKLGESLMKEGIGVSTMGLGLGYNEDLMSRLALAGSGSHVFIEDADNLVQVFQNEFDDVLSVVAQQIKIQVELAEGIRPVKLLNYPADIAGQHVQVELGQLYAKQERYFVLDIEVPYGRSGETMPVGRVNVEYKNMHTDTKDRLSSSVEVKFSDSKEIADRDIDKEAMADCVIQIANKNNREATRLRDEGQIEEAHELLVGNANFLDLYYQQLGSQELRQRRELNNAQAERLKDRDWATNRKSMVEEQYGEAVQQSYRGTGKKK